MVAERFGPVRWQVLAVAVGAFGVVEGPPFGGCRRQFGGAGASGEASMTSVL